MNIYFGRLYGYRSWKPRFYRFWGVRLRFDGELPESDFHGLCIDWLLWTLQFRKKPT